MVQGLSLGGFASLVKVENYNKAFSYIWDYYEYNTDGDIVRKDSRTVEDVGLREEFWQSKMVTLNAKLAYETVINESHHISALLPMSK